MVCLSINLEVMREIWRVWTLELEKHFIVLLEHSNKKLNLRQDVQLNGQGIRMLRALWFQSVTAKAVALVRTNVLGLYKGVTLQQRTKQTLVHHEGKQVR
jgi:hypothetical protein